MYVVVFFISFGVVVDIVKKDESAIKKAIKKFSLQRVAIYCRVSKGNKEESSSIKWQKIT